jgi:hypothetical protein
MDGQRFDRLARLVATRRSAVRGVLAVAIGGSALVAADADARVATCRRGRQTCQRDNQCCSGNCATGPAIQLRDRNRCNCEEGLSRCGNACVDTSSDERNCGGCGVRCAAAEVCSDGECVCVPRCSADSCGKDDGCGGTCGPYFEPTSQTCMTAFELCDADYWFVAGERAECLVSPQGELDWLCDGGGGRGFEWGSSCTQTADCQSWCETTFPDNSGCVCVAYQFYLQPWNAYPHEDYSDGPYCMAMTGPSFGIEDVYAGVCGNYPI